MVVLGGEQIVTLRASKITPGTNTMMASIKRLIICEIRRL